MYIAQINIVGEEGPEERFLGPFESEEELETFIELYDLDSEWYVQVIPPEMLIEEIVCLH